MYDSRRTLAGLNKLYTKSRTGKLQTRYMSNFELPSDMMASEGPFRDILRDTNGVGRGRPELAANCVLSTYYIDAEQFSKLSRWWIP